MPVSLDHRGGEPPAPIPPPVAHDPDDAPVRRSLLATARDGKSNAAYERWCSDETWAHAAALRIPRFAVEGDEAGSARLCLAFCDVAIEAIGGRIWIEDAKPGMAFCVELPMAVDSAAQI